MATVRICDRCGKEISMANIRRYKFGKILLCGSLFTPTVNDETKYDLCPECVKKLDDFFDGKAIAPVEKE